MNGIESRLGGRQEGHQQGARDVGMPKSYVGSRLLGLEALAHFRYLRR